MAKFDGHPNLIKVLSRICIKKNGLLMIEPKKFNCFYNQFAHLNIVSFDPPPTHKVILGSLVRKIVGEQDGQVRIEDIH